MFKKLLSFLLFCTFLFAGCQNKPIEESTLPIIHQRGERYDGKPIKEPLTAVNHLDFSSELASVTGYYTQIEAIAASSPTLYYRNRHTYQAIKQWLEHGANKNALAQFGLRAYQMQGHDHWGNVFFTSYFIPIIKAKYQPDENYRYPIYRLPKQRPHFSRAEIYQGALADQGLELAYTDSLLNNFFMEVQGSAYLDFGDDHPLNFFAFAGKNGYPYRSIGRVLIDRGEIAKDAMSMQAIKHWIAQHDEATLIELLNHNASFVFFSPQGNQLVKGASGVPLIALSAVAADRRLVPPGTVLLAEIPQLNEQGHFTGKYDARLMVALDVGGAIKGHHFDIYQGIGQQAEERAGFYNHYGRVWLLSTPGDDMSHLHQQLTSIH